MRASLGMKHIEAIHAVVLTGSVTGAATRLHVTQPAVSNLIRDAEERLACPLFERRGGRLLPTPLADMLFDRIEQSFTGLEEINEFCKRARDTQRSQLRVACTPAFGATVIPAIAQRLAADDDRVFLSIHSRTAHHVTALVSSRKVDVGFGLEVPDIPGVHAETLAVLPLYCYLPKDHALSSLPSISARQLLDVPLVSLSRMEGIHEKVAQAFAACGREPSAVAECPAAITACGMVAAGLGFTLFDRLPAGLFSGKVTVRPFEPATTLTYKAYWLKSAAGNIDLAQIVQIAREAIRSVADQPNLAIE